jgi:hypothetical protein
LDKKKPLSIVATILILLSVVVLTPLVGQFSISSDEKESLDFTSFEDDELELTRTEIKIHTEFVTPHTLSILYREAGGTAENVLAFSRMIGEDECLIFSVTPEDWDDHRSLAMLGHEVLHCLGGQHS